MKSLMNAEEYDLIVLGSGEGGKYIAWSEAAKGRKVAVIEQKYVGGSCPNIACLPSKNIIHSAKIATYFLRGKEFGIEANDWKINMSHVQNRKRKMVEELVEMHMDHFKESGAELIMGRGEFVGPKTLEVNSSDSKRILRGKQIIINTGSRAKIDPIPGLVESKPLTHIEALDLDVIPKKLLILGGGYVGLELAQAFRRFGSDVAIIERNERLIHREDKDISDAVHELCNEEGIEVYTGVQISKVEGISSQNIEIYGKQALAELILKGSHLLVAGGRTPNTDHLGLGKAGIDVTEKGFIKVNEKLQTTAPDVWAVGDCAGSPFFTHISFDDHRVVKAAFEGKEKSTKDRQVPFCLFIDPEFARIGFSETEAKKQGIPYRLVKMPMKDILRTRTLSETKGFLKALIDEETDQILGFAAFGTGAGEVMAMVQVAMIAKLPFNKLQGAIFTHPTLAEGLVQLFH